MNMARQKNSPSTRQRSAARASGQRIAADRQAAVKSAARRIANFNVPTPAGDGGSGDPPIIISGGGSVHMDMPHGFKDNGTDADHKKYKHDTGDLAELVIDNGAPIPLKKDSRIEIRYK
jgi:hypothetical protein